MVTTRIKVKQISEWVSDRVKALPLMSNTLPKHSEVQNLRAKLSFKNPESVNSVCELHKSYYASMKANPSP